MGLGVGVSVGVSVCGCRCGCGCVCVCVRARALSCECVGLCGGLAVGAGQLSGSGVQGAVGANALLARTSRRPGFLSLGWGSWWGENRTPLGLTSVAYSLSDSAPR